MKTYEKNEICPFCEHKKMIRTEQNHRFKYGKGDDAVELKTNVPILSCDHCKAMFMNWEADQIMEKEIERHLDEINKRHT